MNPLILINFKTYPSGTGSRAIALAHTVAAAAKQTGANFAIAVQAVDLSSVARAVSIPVFAQHVDPVEQGAYTGAVVAESLKTHGVAGALLNHAEHRIDRDAIRTGIERCRNAGLQTVVCTDRLDEAVEVAKIGPWAIAFEDPFLIATGKSISTMKPAQVERFVAAVRAANPNVIPLCGAGVSTKADIDAALKLGTQGVLLSSAVMMAKEPDKAVTGLV